MTLFLLLFHPGSRVKVCVCLNCLILTGCCGASLSVLKTCATFPLALRCILKLGMAQRVARLITLKKQHDTRSISKH